ITEARRTKSELERQLSDTEANYQIALLRSKEQKEENQQPIHDEFEIRAKLLNEQLESLSDKIAERTKPYANLRHESVDLKIRQCELEQLQSVARDMSIKLEQMDVDSSMPDRVRVIQWAM